MTSEPPDGPDGNGPLRRIMALNERGLAATEQLLAVMRESSRTVAELRRQNQELEQRLAGASGFDPVTGLLNARGFTADLAREEARARRFGASVVALLLVVEGLSPLRQARGEAAADAVVRAVATAIQDSGRASDVVARCTDATFAVLLLGASPAGARIFCERVATAVPAVALPDGSTVPVRLSSGIATRDEAGSLEEALDLARSRLSPDQRDAAT